MKTMCRCGTALTTLPHNHSTPTQQSECSGQHRYRQPNDPPNANQDDRDGWPKEQSFASKLCPLSPHRHRFGSTPAVSLPPRATSSICTFMPQGG